MHYSSRISQLPRGADFINAAMACLMMMRKQLLASQHLEPRIEDIVELLFALATVPMAKCRAVFMSPSAPCCLPVAVVQAIVDSLHQARSCRIGDGSSMDYRIRRALSRFEYLLATIAKAQNSD